MILAIPIWEGRVSPVLDTARCLLTVRLEEGHEVERDELPLDEQTPSARAETLAERGVALLICGAVTAELRAAVVGRGIDLIPWTMGAVDEVLDAYLGGELSDPRYAMPGAN